MHGDCVCYSAAKVHVGGQHHQYPAPGQHSGDPCNRADFCGGERRDRSIVRGRLKPGSHPLAHARDQRGPRTAHMAHRDLPGPADGPGERVCCHQPENPRPPRHHRDVVGNRGGRRMGRAGDDSLDFQVPSDLRDFWPRERLRLHSDARHHPILLCHPGSADPRAFSAREGTSTPSGATRMPPPMRAFPSERSKGPDFSLSASWPESAD